MKNQPKNRQCHHHPPVPLTICSVPRISIGWSMIQSPKPSNSSTTRIHGSAAPRIARRAAGSSAGVRSRAIWKAATIEPNAPR